MVIVVDLFLLSLSPPPPHSRYHYGHCQSCCYCWNLVSSSSSSPFSYLPFRHQSFAFPPLFHIPLFSTYFSLNDQALSALEEELYSKMLSKKLRFFSQLRKSTIIGIAAAPTDSVANWDFGVLKTSLIGSTSNKGYDRAVFLGGDHKPGTTVARLIRLAHWSWYSFLPIFANWFPSTNSMRSLFSCK